MSPSSMTRSWRMPPARQRSRPLNTSRPGRASPTRRPVSGILVPGNRRRDPLGGSNSPLMNIGIDLNGQLLDSAYTYTVCGLNLSPNTHNRPERDLHNRLLEIADGVSIVYF